MNPLDGVIIVTMIFLVIKGVFRGFIRETASIAGVILGVWMGSHYQPQMTIFFRAYLPATPLLPLISFAGIFAFVLILCNLLGWVLRLLFKKAFLGWADRILGALLSMAKGVIITYLAIVLLTFFLPAKTPLIAGSSLAPWVITSYQHMIRLISPDHYEKWKKKIMGGKKEMTDIISNDIKDMENKT